MRNTDISSFFKAKLLIVLISAFGFMPLLKAQKSEIKVLTYNIRLATPGDAPNTWANRNTNVYALIRQASPDVFGLQEALKEQVTDIEKAFPDYTRVGAGRDDGKEAGEFSPLFFNLRKFTLLASGTFWLSQTPSVPGSKGWDAACNRVVTWIKLKERKSKAEFFVFCTHFDHMGEVARRNSSKFILHAVDSLASYSPVIVLGDFNAEPDSEPYKLITDYSSKTHLTDARLICPDVKGPEYTFTGFKIGAQPGIRIDYIFIKNNVKVIKYVVNESNNGEYYPSDHLPVNATLSIY
jgi:endonuclease/exonuclease/phosphatase family metal-dependent hydrolase